jgi:hypothetical protein
LLCKASDYLAAYSTKSLEQVPTRIESPFSREHRGLKPYLVVENGLCYFTDEPRHKGLFVFVINLDKLAEELVDLGQLFVCPAVVERAWTEQIALTSSIKSHQTDLLLEAAM